MEKVIEKVVFGLDCFGHYIVLQSGKFYVDKVFQDMLPGDLVTLSIRKEEE